jgi:16S rRNA processing protein RimM
LISRIALQTPFLTILINPKIRDYFYVPGCIASIKLSLRRTLVLSVRYSPFTIDNSPLAEYFKIGKFVAAHGIKGELLLKHELGKKTSLKGLKIIFIEEKKNSLLPWFVEIVKLKNGEEVLMKLEGVSTREAAVKLAQKEVWFSEEDLKKFSAKSSPIHLLGYTIVNGEKPVGEILEIIEQAHQMLCRIEINGTEVLIPLNEGTLRKINHNRKEVMVSLPDGLLEIYLK